MSHVSSIGPSNKTGNVVFSDAVTATGTGTLNGATAVAVASTAITATSKIYLGIMTVAGTPAGAPYVATITAGTGFTVKTAAGDTSVFSWYAVD